MLMRSMEETQAEPAAPEPTTAEPAAAAAEAQKLALEQRCAKLEAELTALRARLHEAEARYATRSWARALDYSTERPTCSRQGLLLIILTRVEPRLCWAA